MGEGIFAAAEPGRHHGRDDAASRVYRVVWFAEGQEHEFGWHRVLANSFVDTDAWYAAYDVFYLVTRDRWRTIPDRPTSYGEALIPKAYVQQRWAPFLKFVHYVDDRTALPQALIVMQKGLERRQRDFLPSRTNRYLKHARIHVRGSRKNETFFPCANDRDRS